MFLVILFILLISDFIVEDLNFLANDAAEAAEKISQLEVTIVGSLSRCGRQLCQGLRRVCRR
ncbi:hypothetical protein [Rhizobium mongolense]|uniref:hypothetical protein n=1 Tax=Rhizobium mongolense TaxID=57676 RepID=UPI0034A160DE